MIPSIRNAIPKSTSIAHIREDQPIAIVGSRSLRTSTTIAPIKPAAENNVPKKCRHTERDHCKIQAGKKQIQSLAEVIVRRSYLTFKVLDLDIGNIMCCAENST